MWLIHRIPHILNLGNIWRKVVSFTYQTVFYPGKGHASHLIVDCVGLSVRLGTSIWRGGDLSFYLPEIEPPILERLVPSLVIIQTEISPLIFYICFPIFIFPAPMA